MTEYMNSANSEEFTQIHAKSYYSVLIATSKHVYISDQSSNGFFPVFGKSPGSFHFKKLDPQVYLNGDSILLMDPVKSIFRYEIEVKPGI